MMNFKNINIGALIENKIIESEIDINRICKFMNCTESELIETYKNKEISTEDLLRWSKLLQYDFFRLYSQHLILYAPFSSEDNKSKLLPEFRKNIYTKEIIDFIINQITTKKMTKNDVMERYRIPKTTLYKWLHKYGNT